MSRLARDVRVDDLLGDAAAQRHLDLRDEVLPRVGDAVCVRVESIVAEGHPTRDDRDLADWVRARGEHADEGMTGLVVRGPFAVRGRERDPRGDQRSFSSESVKSGGLDLGVVAAGSQERGLVGEVGQVSADHPGARRRFLGIHIRGQWDVARVHFEDLAPALPVGRLDGDAPVEAPRPQQGRVEHVGAVRGQHDDRLGAFEAVHFGQDLVERLLALAVRPGDRHASLAGTADRVELVDEDDRGGGLLGLVRGARASRPRRSPR